MKYQSMQALIYQIVAVVVIGGFTFITIIVSVLSFGILGLLMFPLQILLVSAIVVYGLFGAYKCYAGEDFKYLVIGDMVK